MHQQKAFYFKKRKSQLSKNKLKLLEGLTRKIFLFYSNRNELCPDGLYHPLFELSAPPSLLSSLNNSIYDTTTNQNSNNLCSKSSSKDCSDYRECLVTGGEIITVNKTYCCRGEDSCQTTSYLSIQNINNIAFRCDGLTSCYDGSITLFETGDIPVDCTHSFILNKFHQIPSG